MEASNVKAMRDALKQALYFLRRHHMGSAYAPDGETLIYCDDVAVVIDNTLSLPLRNCDVGTAEEQYVRFEKWCEDEFYKRPMNALTGEPCKSCPCYSVPAGGVDGCNYLRWAQMPYEELD